MRSVWRTPSDPHLPEVFCPLVWPLRVEARRRSFARRGVEAAAGLTGLVLFGVGFYLSRRRS